MSCSLKFGSLGVWEFRRSPPLPHSPLPHSDRDFRKIRKYFRNYQIFFGKKADVPEKRVSGTSF